MLGELQMALERASGPGLRISGHIAARQSCDGEAGSSRAPWAHTMRGTAKCQRRGQGGYRRDPGGWGVNGRGASLRPPVPPLCSPAKCPLRGGCPDPSSDGCSGLSQPYTARKRLPELPSKSQGWGRGGAGGEKAAGQDGALDYRDSGPSPSLLVSFALPTPALQVQVVGTGSEVMAMTLETKPQRRNQHTVLCHMVGLQPGGHRVSTSGRPGLQGPGNRVDSVGGLWEAMWDEQGCLVLFTHLQSLSLMR